MTALSTLARDLPPTMSSATASASAHPPIPLYADRLRATLIGRGPHCHVNIAAQDPATAKKISRRHALLVWDTPSASFRLCVLGLNGVLLNGIARFADDDDDDEGHQGIALKPGDIMEFPGGVRFEFMGERAPAAGAPAATTLASSPLRALRLQPMAPPANAPSPRQRVQVEVQPQELVDNALDAVQGLLSLASSSSAKPLSAAALDKENQPTMRPPATRPHMPSPEAAPRRGSPAKPKPPAMTSGTGRRDPVRLPLVDDTMDVEPTNDLPAGPDDGNDPAFDPDQTLPAMDLLSARARPATAEHEHPPAPLPLPSTPPRARPAVSPQARDDATDDDDDLSSSSSSCSSSSPKSPPSNDPHGPPPMPLPDVLVESFTFCARSDLSLAELLAEIAANQVYFRTHPRPALWHAQVLRTLESHGMFALRPRNKWLKRATQWYYDPDRDADAARAARFREFGSAQPARRAKRRADTQYYVKDLTGKPVTGRAAGGVRVVRPENNDDDDDDDAEEDHVAEAGAVASSSKRPRTAPRGRAGDEPENDAGVMPSSDATLPGSPVIKRKAALRPLPAKKERGVGAVRLDLE